MADLMAGYKVFVAGTRGHCRSSYDGSAYRHGLLAADYAVISATPDGLV